MCVCVHIFMFLYYICMFYIVNHLNSTNSEYAVSYNCVMIICLFPRGEKQFVKYINLINQFQRY